MHLYQTINFTFVSCSSFLPRGKQLISFAYKWTNVDANWLTQFRLYIEKLNISPLTQNIQKRTILFIVPIVVCSEYRSCNKIVWTHIERVIYDTNTLKSNITNQLAFYSIENARNQFSRQIIRIYTNLRCFCACFCTIVHQPKKNYNSKYKMWLIQDIVNKFWQHTIK